MRASEFAALCLKISQSLIPNLNFNEKKHFGGKKSLFSNLKQKHYFSSVFLFKGARGFPGTPGLPGFKGIRVSTFSTQRRVNA